MSADHDVDATAASPSTGSPPAGAGTGFVARLGRVFSFDASVYEEVAAAPATVQAIAVISIAAMLSGSAASIILFFVVVPGALFFVAVHTVLVLFVTRLFGGRAAPFADWYRVLGFAQAPLVIGLVPLFGWFVAPVYCFACEVTAISRVARLPTGLAFLALLVTWLPFLLLLGLLFALGMAAVVLGVLGAASA